MTENIAYQWLGSEPGVFLNESGHF